MTSLKKRKHLTSSQIIIFGFAALILTGTFLLMLPFATRQWGGAGFLDALFTATSASCVTGLIVQDTATYWSPFGQTVIIMLIQIGGMGVVTMALAITMISGKKIGLSRRSTMQESISAPQVGGIVKMTGFIIKTSLLIELAGAVMLMPVFCPEFGVVKGILYSLFHSVSAFCNAGFDLMGTKAKFSSLTSYADNITVNAVIMILIIVGGIGFSTWSDIKTNGFKFKKYRMQSKVVFAMTAILIVLPTLYFYFFEYSLPVYGDISFKQRLLYSLFRTVSPRTAGFNTADLTLLTESGRMISVILMVIGGCPGSTAGGMKTTTVAVMAANCFAIFTRKESPHFFGRRITDETVKNAGTILMMYVTLLIASTVAISCMENLPIVTCMFETASAIGTVGLTLGITPGLCRASRLILISLMFFGRVGGLTLIFAAVKDMGKIPSKLPRERITVG